MDVSSAQNRPTPPIPQSKRVEEAPKEATKPKVASAQHAPEAKPLPVINTQGQATGRLLNATA